MSSSYYLYAERKQKSQNQWQLVSDRSMCEFFKGFISIFDEEYEGISLWEIMDDLSAKDASEGLKKHYTVECEGESDEEVFECSTVRYISSSDLKSYLNKAADTFTLTMDCVYKALDVPFRNDIDEYPDTGKYDDDGNLNKNYTPLALPVNKDLFMSLANKRFVYQAAMQVLGMIEAAETMAGVDSYEFHDDPVEVRFVVVYSP